MKTKSISTAKFIIKHGVILGILWILSFLLTYLINDSFYFRPDDVFAIIIEIILHISLAYPIYRYKKINNGFLSLKQALKIGTGIALITYSIAQTHLIVLHEFIKPEETI